MGVATIQFERSQAVAAPAPNLTRARRRPRVLHVINGEDYSGAERVQDLLAQRLPDFGFDVGFACVLPNRFRDARSCQSTPLYEAPMRNRFDVRPVVPVARLIRREAYQLVHTHSARAALVGRPAAALAGVPIVHHMHCQTATEARHVWLTRLNAIVERMVLWGVHGVVAVSETLHRYLLRHGYCSKNIHLVPNGVPSSQDIFASARPAGSAWTIGTVAMFRPRKGIEVLLEAVAKLRSAGLPTRLRAVGRFQSPAYEREVMQRTRNLGLEDAVDWTGFCHDVQAELKQMDIFVLPSLVNEAMPMSILEAMAAGVPVVGTKVEGVTDLIRDRRDGLIAAAGDADDLARALTEIIQGNVDCQRLRCSAHRRQVDCFSDDSMAAGIARVYEKILCK